MWERSELKSRAKIAFKRNYWKCVLVAFILALLCGNHSSSGNGSNHNSNNDSSYNITSEDGSILDSAEGLLNGLPAEGEIDDAIMENTSKGTFNLVGNVFKDLPIGLAGLVMTLGISLGILIILLNTFVFSVIEVGGLKFFVDNIYGDVGVGTLFSGFNKNQYMDIVATQFLRNLFTFLWSLLFVIPGIVKSYEYRMIPYILGEYQNISSKEAFEMSRQMMNGNKMKTFILDLSFIGWDILNVFTLGLLGLLYVNPYKQATRAELYETLKSQQMSQQMA